MGSIIKLGWSTTNNNPDLDELYAFAVDTTEPDHYILDGKIHPIQRRVITVYFKNGPGIAQHREEVLTTQFGPVVSREQGYIYVLKQGANKEVRRSGTIYSDDARSKSGRMERSHALTGYLSIQLYLRGCRRKYLLCVEWDNP